MSEQQFLAIPSEDEEQFDRAIPWKISLPDDALDHKDWDNYRVTISFESQDIALFLIQKILDETLHHGEKPFEIELRGVLSTRMPFERLTPEEAKAVWARECERQEEEWRNSTQGRRRRK